MSVRREGRGGRGGRRSHTHDGAFRRWTRQFYTLCVGAVLVMVGAGADELTPIGEERFHGGREEAIAAIESLYMLYTTHMIELRDEDSNQAVREEVTVTEYWIESGRARERTHTVTTRWVEGDESVPRQSASEVDAVLTEDGMRIVKRVFDGNRVKELPEVPYSFARYRHDRERLKSPPLLNHGFAHEIVDRYVKLRPSLGDALELKGWRELYGRGDEIVMANLASEAESPEPSYWIFDTTKGFLSVASETGRSNWSDGVVEDSYGSVHCLPMEAAPGVWMPGALVHRWAWRGGRQHTVYRIVECWANRTIPPAVFDPEQVGFEGFAAPAGSPLAGGRTVAVDRATMDEATGKAERRVRQETGAPPPIFGYHLRGEDFSVPTRVDAAAEPVSAAAGADLVRWLVVIGAVTVICAAAYRRYRTA